MRFKLLACKVLFREISYLAATCPHIIDTTFLKQDYHDIPQTLCEQLQLEIDKIDEGNDPYSSHDGFDAILLGYGLCSNAILGLKSKKYKIVVPKAHDCITLFLGSKEKYREYFDAHDGGVYWYNAGWIENTPMPSKKRYEDTYQKYTDKYGEDNAEYLMEMEQDWLTKYKLCTFVDWNQFDNTEPIAYTKQCAEYLNWSFEKIEGNVGLLTDFLYGNWDVENFLVVPPGKTIAASYDEKIIKCDNLEEKIK